jgi:hypothetical protein
MKKPIINILESAGFEAEITNRKNIENNGSTEVYSISSPLTPKKRFIKSPLYQYPDGMVSNRLFVFLV